MRLSVLDQSTIVTGRDAASSIRETLELARHCEALGYHRYWMAEHHNTPSQAGTAPEVLAAAVAATTQRIRVGTAGVMLPHYSALKVAEQFRVLDAIAPGRIDMGLGRAPGSDGLTAHALNPNAAKSAEMFPAAVRDLLAWVSGESLPDQHPFRAVIANPAGPTTPEPWILGSSDYGAQVAAHFGLPYGFAHFITDGEGCAEAIYTYRRLYRPSARFPAPIASVTVWAMCAESEEEAERQFLPRAIFRLGRDRGVFRPLLSPEEAAEAEMTPLERHRVERMRETALYGTREKVGAALRKLADEVQVEEIAVLTAMHDPQTRRRSYELLAEEFGIS
jgi:luciferase family oxidoreductase group 1